MSNALLEVRDLRKEFRASGGRGKVYAVAGVHFTIRKGETLGLVGESGSGKSTTARLLLRLEEPTAGKVLFDGQDVSSAKGEALRRYRTRVQAVFQDPYSSLSPRMAVKEIIAEPLIANTALTRPEIDERVVELLGRVGLGGDAASRYPHEFSGGQRQRIAIARGVVLQPELVVLDEPVSALDASVRGQILNLLSELQDRNALSYLLISHDLDVVAHMCSVIAVMYLGRIVEIAPQAALMTEPKHPYTKVLFSAALPRRPGRRVERIKIVGEPPSPLSPPSGCAFHTRCPWVMPICSQVRPELRPTGEGALTACHLHDQAASSLASSVEDSARATP
jgi:peptide/nickel transport system ATP-binding protein